MLINIINLLFFYVLIFLPYFVVTVMLVRANTSWRVNSFQELLETPSICFNSFNALLKLGKMPILYLRFVNAPFWC